MLAGESLASVCRWLESQDPQGWRSDTLRRVLTNPTLAGHRTNKGKITGPGTWAPILTDEQHLDLVAVFAARPAGPRGLPVRHLCSGIARCGVCGGRLWVNKGSGGRHNYICRKTCVSRDQGKVDAAVHAVIEAVLSSAESRAVLAEPPARTDPTAPARLAELRRRLEGVETEIAEGRTPPDSGSRILTHLAGQIAAAEAAAAPVFVDPTVRQVATAPDPIGMWRSLPIDGQRQLIRAVLTVTVEPIGRGRWRDKRAGLVITPRPAAGATAPLPTRLILSESLLTTTRKPDGAGDGVVGTGPGVDFLTAYGAAGDVADLLRLAPQFAEAFVGQLGVVPDSGLDRGLGHVRVAAHELPHVHVPGHVVGEHDRGRGVLGRGSNRWPHVGGHVPADLAVVAAEVVVERTEVPVDVPACRSPLAAAELHAQRNWPPATLVPGRWWRMIQLSAFSACPAIEIASRSSVRAVLVDR